MPDASRAARHMEIPAILLSFALAPVACLAVAFVAWPVGILVGMSVGVVSPDGDPADRGHSLLPLAGIVAAAFWLISLPALLAIWAAGKLSFWTVVPPAIVLPVGFLASFALWGWTNGGASPLPWFMTAALLLVPETATTAGAFWSLYCFLTGHRFLTPPPWKRRVAGAGPE